MEWASFAYETGPFHSISDRVTCKQVLNFMVILGFMFNYMLRVNLTIAIVAMVHPGNKTDSSGHLLKHTSECSGLGGSTDNNNTIARVLDNDTLERTSEVSGLIRRRKAYGVNPPDKPRRTPRQDRCVLDGEGPGKPISNFRLRPHEGPGSNMPALEYPVVIQILLNTGNKRSPDQSLVPGKAWEQYTDGPSTTH
uniref:Uncharacterized protein n=1 Tax=Timema bartmani TaxID=61472 RepID=A0A7R9F6W8_9NEOP|nr:unnamed protein product [Timema bartmani]